MKQPAQPGARQSQNLGGRVGIKDGTDSAADSLDQIGHIIVGGVEDFDNAGVFERTPQGRQVDWRQRINQGIFVLGGDLNQAELRLVTEIRVHLSINRDDLALHEALDQSLDFIPPREQPGGARRGFHWAQPFDLSRTEPCVGLWLTSKSRLL